MSALTRPRALSPARPWPSPQQLQAMGFVKCASDHCRTHLDPVNSRSRFCQSCTREQRDKRRAERFHHRPRVHSAQSAA